MKDNFETAKIMTSKIMTNFSKVIYKYSTAPLQKTLLGVLTGHEKWQSKMKKIVTIARKRKKKWKKKKKKTKIIIGSYNIWNGNNFRIFMVEVTYSSVININCYIT